MLFDGANALQERFVDAVAEAQESAAPIDAMAAGLQAVTDVFAGRREYSRRRQAVIQANAELRERELIKLASMSTALAGALRGRGVAEPVASLTAEAGVAVFKVGFELWIAPAEQRELSQVMRESLDALKSATASGQTV